MRSRVLTVAAASVLLAGVAGAQSMTWNGAADGDDWYDFNSIPDTWNPQMWVNNWGDVFYRYPDDPAPTGMETPTDTATIPLGLVAEIGSHVLVTTIELDGILEIRHQLTCAQVNVAGNLRMDLHGYVTGCAIQGDGPSGFLSSMAEVGSTLSGPTLDGVTLSVRTELGDDTRLGIAGVITNLDVIQLLDSATAGEARLVIDSDATLTGPGWVETSDSPDNVIGSRHNPHHRLTNQSAIHAAGLVGYNIAITNQDLIVADRATTLTVDPTDTPDDGLPGVINQGTLRAADGATLRLERGTFANVGGVIEALESSTVELGRATFLSGGVLATSGTGVIRSSHEAGNTTADPQIRDLTVTGLLEVPNARRLEIAGALDLTGTIRLDSTGSTARLVVDSATTLTGAGEVVMSDDSHNQIGWYSAAGHRLTTDVTIRGSGEFVNIAVTNNGVVRAEGATALVIDPWDTPIDAGPPFDNDGTLTAAAGGTLRLEKGLFDNAGGVVEAASGGVVELGVDGVVQGGTVRSSGAGAVRSITGWHPPILRDVTVDGRVEVPDGTDLWLGGSVVNNGVIAAEDNILPSGDLILAGSGELQLIDGAEIHPDGTSVTNGADHTISASGADQCWIHERLDSLGTVWVASGASLRLNDTFTPAPGSLTRVDGTLQALGTLEMAGLLSGNGTVSGWVELEPTGMLSPGGTGAGTLTTGDILVLDGASYRWQISASTGPDLVDVAGELNLGGSILQVDVHVTSGDVPDRIELFEYDALASVPTASQFVLSEGYTFSGIDTSGDRLALTGVANPTFIFADDFESGDVSHW